MRPNGRHVVFLVDCEFRKDIPIRFEDPNIQVVVCFTYMDSDKLARRGNARSGVAPTGCSSAVVSFFLWCSYRLGALIGLNPLQNSVRAALIVDNRPLPINQRSMVVDVVLCAASIVTSLNVVEHANRYSGNLSIVRIKRHREQLFTSAKQQVARLGITRRSPPQFFAIDVRQTPQPFPFCINQVNLSRHL